MSSVRQLWACGALAGQQRRTHRTGVPAYSTLLASLFYAGVLFARLPARGKAARLTEFTVQILGTDSCSCLALARRFLTRARLRVQARIKVHTRPRCSARVCVWCARPAALCVAGKQLDLRVSHSQLFGSKQSASAHS